MNFLKNIDGRSFFIGLLLMVVFFLAAALGDAKKKCEVLQQEAAEMEEQAAQPYPTLFQQEEMASRTLEQRAQSMLDGVIGKGRALAKVRATMNPEGEIIRLSMAMSIDQTKVVMDPEGHYVEEERAAEEITLLAALAQEAIGTDESRGDKVTVFAQHVDRVQEIREREMARAEERKNFWTNVAKIAAIVVAMWVLRWAFLRRDADRNAFFTRSETQTALFLATGLFLCLLALGFGGARLSAAEVGAWPGLFLLIVGLLRAWPAKKTDGENVHV